MPRFGKFLGEFLADESGVSAVEYAMLLAIVAAGIMVGAYSLSAAVTGKMETSADCIDGTTNAANC